MSNHLPVDPGFFHYQSPNWWDSHNNPYQPIHEKIDPLPHIDPSLMAKRKSAFFPEYYSSAILEGVDSAFKSKFHGHQSIFLDHSYDPLERFRSKSPKPLSDLERLYTESHRLMSTGRRCGKTFKWSQFLEDPYEMKQISPGGLFASKDICDLVRERQAQQDGVDAFVENDIRNWLHEIPIVSRAETDLEAARKMFKRTFFTRKDNGSSAGNRWPHKSGSYVETTLPDGKTTITVNFPDTYPVVYHFRVNGELEEVINTQPQKGPDPLKPHEEHCMLEPVYAHSFGGPVYEGQRRRAWAKMNESSK